MAKQKKLIPRGLDRRHSGERRQGERRAPPPIVRDTGLSDEGVGFEWVDTVTIVNASGDFFDQRRPQLHIAGRTFAHVAQEGQRRVYRYDR